MVKDKIRKDIVKCLKQLELKFNDNFVVEVPNNPEHGDFSSNVALVNAKLNKVSPQKLAEKIIEYFSKKRDYKSVSVAGPGFINFKLANNFYHRKLLEINEKNRKFGSSEYGNKKKVLLEFISANPTGPLNVVSARAAAFGDTLCRIMRFVGFRAYKEFYINDAGNQVDILAESLELRYRELHGERIDEFPPEAYHGEYIKDLAAKLNSVESKLLHYSETDRLRRMKQFALEEVHKMQQESLKRFDVTFDNWMSEKKLRQEGAVEEVLSYLAEAHCTYEKDEAIWFSSTEFGDEKDRVLMKADGNTTYLVPDIAYHLTKYQRKFDYLIDILGPDHHGYVPRLKAAIMALGYDVNKLEIIYLQHITLFEGGQQVKMSKRAGKIVTMDDLIDEVGKDAARYFFVSRKPNAHLEFDLELAKKKSNENPVYYVQYAHARIASILRKAKKEKISLKNFDHKLLRKLNKEDELTIIKKMLELPNLLISAADAREPHRLANYVYDLAGMFHKYYAKFKIVDKKNPELSQSRLFLISNIKTVLAVCLHLMGISAPQKM
ncbi:MAG: arginine--tRNA ligase [Candidatus Cloacimonas sp. 4484_275]|nr:MAG: arginine--tRNA ligase [Candidatus Cloacimonas sp. 4484_275]